MDTQEKKPKQLIPQKAQIPLILIGVPLLLIVCLKMAKDMGWISNVPHAAQ